MNRRVGWCLLTILGAASVACGDPDQLYRHRDAGAGPTGAAGGGGHVGALAGAGGLTGSGAAGAAGAGTGMGGALTGTSGGGGSAGGATGTGGATGNGGGASGASGASGGGGSTSGASGATGTGGGGSNGGAGSTGTAGATGNGGATGGAGSSGVDASADGMPACTSTPDCHCDYYGGHAYKFCGAGRPYADAATACASQGMRLIRVDDEGENQWAYNGKVSRGFVDMWIGADDRAVAGDWRWSDGTAFWTGKAGAAGAGPVGGLFNAWQTGQPDHANTNEDCAAYNSGNDRWADLPCTNYNAYVCELY
jgi:hypothetical protein